MRHSEHYTPWHGHITVLTVAPASRRLGHARRLTESLERSSDINDAWFVDLYVRAGNKVAVGMYKGMGYAINLAPNHHKKIITGAKNYGSAKQILGIPTSGELLQRRPDGSFRRRGCV